MTDCIAKDWFEYQEREIQDYFRMLYYNCKLKKSIGLHKAGEEVSGICIDYNDGLIELYLSEQIEPECHPISLQVQ